jgi:hypothetical protein
VRVEDNLAECAEIEQTELPSILRGLDEILCQLSVKGSPIW